MDSWRHIFRLSGLALADLGCTLCCLWGFTALLGPSLINPEMALCALLGSYLLATLSVGLRGKLSLALGAFALFFVDVNGIATLGILLVDAFLFTNPAVDSPCAESAWSRNSLIRGRWLLMSLLYWSFWEVFDVTYQLGHLVKLVQIAGFFIYTAIGHDLPLTEDSAQYESNPTL